MGGNLITWRSKKQNLVVQLSAEAEYGAIAQGVCELESPYFPTTSLLEQAAPMTEWSNMCLSLLGTTCCKLRTGWRWSNMQIGGLRGNLQWEIGPI